MASTLPPTEAIGAGGAGVYWTDSDDPSAVVVAQPLPDADIPDPSFEDRAYPKAPLALRSWFRDNRNDIRAFLLSPLGKPNRPAKGERRQCNHV
jgi:hypothetical protein